MAVLAAFTSKLWAAEQPHVFRAGASAVDISPPTLPVRVNGMFTERSAEQVFDPLYARSIALDDGVTRIVFCVVDTCMMPRDLIDRAKEIASVESGLGTDRMMVSATHTHSAPSAMACLGSRMDPDYAAWLPAKIAEGIIAAQHNLQPARIGWASVDDWAHTHNRRWIRRADRPITDPFGEPTVRANMHPGYESPDVVGPSGPVDPGLSVLAVQTLGGEPLALMANYSQHYFGSPLLSADYFGVFSRNMAALLGQASSVGPFVAMMSQGTSGDLMWMDYGAPEKKRALDSYSDEMAAKAMEAYQKIEWHDYVPLGIVEKKLPLRYRVPDAARLAWAKEKVAALQGKLPSDQSEIYAHEAIFLHEKQRTELILHAIRIGDLSIATLPNEVYAITGLKLKAKSPQDMHFNIELANGAEGYIPPAEQFTFGGYTTWPARTAGLEEAAESKIVDTLLTALEEVFEKPRKRVEDEHGPFAKAILDAKPVAYWRLNEIEGRVAHNAVAHGPDAHLTGGAALYLPGVGSGSGNGEEEALRASNFSGATQINRAVHFADGMLEADLALGGDQWSVALWFWLGEASGASARNGSLLSLPSGASLEYQLREDGTSKLILTGTGENVDPIEGQASVPIGEWHFATLVNDAAGMRVFVDGQGTPDIHTDTKAVEKPSSIQFAKGLEGKLDEIAVFDHALTNGEVFSFWEASGVGTQRAQARADHVPAENETAARPRAKLESAPLSPEAGLKSSHVPKGYAIDLVASEPQVIDPVAFDWDTRGRLWVVEMADYPLGMDGKGAAGGRVRVLEDRDENGDYERATLFADGLNFPTGILTWWDGAIVSAAPDILFLRDTDGDGMADERRVLLTGLTEGNQQLRANGLRWGLDNWVYVAAGGHHGKYGLDTKIRSADTGLDVAIGSRDFRFRPDTGEVVPESGPTQFGRNRDDWGHWFGTQNSHPIWHYVLPDHYLQRNPHLAIPDGRVQILAGDNPPVYPTSAFQKRFHTFLHAGHYTSACSGMIYRDTRLFPREEMNAFVCEPFHNVVQRILLEPNGVTFSGTRGGVEGTPDLFASDDGWCRPVMARTGPDGGLWISDMYRYMIEHPEWLPEEARQELLPFYREGDDRGRIYRIRREVDTPGAIPNLESMDTSTLVGQLASPNGWVRDKVQQLLLWRTDASAVPALEALATGSQYPVARLHALCTLDGLNALSPALVVRALADAHPGVRENALRLAESRVTPEIDESIVRLVEDSDARVRLQLAFTLGALSATPAVGDALATLLVRDQDSPFIVVAALSSALPHQERLIATLAGSEIPTPAHLRRALVELALAAENRDAVATLIAPAFTLAIKSSDAPSIASCVELLDLLGRRAKSVPALSDGATEGPLFDLANEFTLLTDHARALYRDEYAAHSVRTASAALLARVPDERNDALTFLFSCVQPLRPPDEFQETLTALAGTGDEQVPDKLIMAWSGLSPLARGQVLDQLLSRTSWTRHMTEAIKIGIIHSSDFDPTRRTRLLNHPDEELRKDALTVFASGAPSERAKIVADYAPALTLNGDVSRGLVLYRNTCMPCHKHGDLGMDIGPDFRTVALHPPEKILSNILDPNLDIQPGYQAYNCELNDWEQLYGLIVSENAVSITMKLAGGNTRTILRRDIAKLESTNRSLMPEGWEESLTQQDLADLIAFVKSGP